MTILYLSITHIIIQNSDNFLAKKCFNVHSLFLALFLFMLHNWCAKGYKYRQKLD